MSQRMAPLKVPTVLRRTLEEIAHSRGLPMQEVRRARALLLAADGVSNVEIAERCGVTPRTIANWRGRFLDDGVDAVRWDRRGRVPPEEIPVSLVRFLLDREAEPQTGAHMAELQRRFPWLLRRVETAGGGMAVVRAPISVTGLYLNSSQRAVALNAPRESPRHTRAGYASPEPQGGTTTVLSELTSDSDTVFSNCMSNSHRDFLSFLKFLDWRVSRAEDIYLLMNGHLTHLDHYEVDRWLANPKRSRIHLHLIPSAVLWNNLVAHWLRQASCSGIALHQP